MRIGDWSSDVCSSDLDGLRDRTRRPLTSPGQTSPEIEGLVLRRRKQLLEAGKDHGAQSIVWALQRDGIHSVPSPSTVWQILTRRGAITPQPQKRPKSATKRFTFARPNECWQSDWTQWSLADGSARSEEHTSELQSLMRISYAVFCLKNKQ